MGTDRTVLRQGVQIGTALASLWLVLWAVVVFTTEPEPREFLDWVEARDTPPVDTPNGVKLNLRLCADCPMFLVMDRGFGSAMERPFAMLLTSWSLPAIWATSQLMGETGIVVFNPLVFGVALAVQWLVVGLSIRGVLYGIARLRA